MQDFLLGRTTLLFPPTYLFSFTSAARRWHGRTRQHTPISLLPPTRQARTLFLYYYILAAGFTSYLYVSTLALFFYLSGIRQRRSGRLKRVSAGRGLAQKPALLCTAGTGEEHNRQIELAGIGDDAGVGQVQDIGRFHAGKSWAQGCRSGQSGADAGPDEAGGAAESQCRPGAAETARRGRDTAWPGC
jgi:hypothetical protein